MCPIMSLHKQKHTLQPISAAPAATPAIPAAPPTPSADLSSGDRLAKESDVTVGGDAVPPETEYFGFALHVGSLFALLLYLAWAALPRPVLYALHIYYYPSRWWALAFPCYLLVAVAYTYVALFAYNTEILTRPVSQLCVVTDTHARIVAPRNQHEFERRGDGDRDRLRDTARDTTRDRDSPEECTSPTNQSDGAPENTHPSLQQPHSYSARAREKQQPGGEHQNSHNFAATAHNDYHANGNYNGSYNVGEGHAGGPEAPKPQCLPTAVAAPATLAGAPGTGLGLGLVLAGTAQAPDHSRRRAPCRLPLLSPDVPCQDQPSRHGTAQLGVAGGARVAAGTAGAGDAAGGPKRQEQVRTGGPNRPAAPAKTVEKKLPHKEARKEAGNEEEEEEDEKEEEQGRQSRGDDPSWSRLSAGDGADDDAVLPWPAVVPSSPSAAPSPAESATTTTTTTDGTAAATAIALPCDTSNGVPPPAARLLRRGEQVAYQQKYMFSPTDGVWDLPLAQVCRLLYGGSASSARQQWRRGNLEENSLSSHSDSESDDEESIPGLVMIS